MTKALLPLAMIFTFTANAQVTYFHYLNYSVGWTWEQSYPGYYEFEHLYVHGDTLKNGNWYYDLWNDRYTNGVNENSHASFLREDSLKRFYEWIPGDTAERNWYTFNLNQVGDTLTRDSSGGNWHYNFVTYIDTIYIGSEPRRRFNDGYPSDQFIEGIGNPGYINSHLKCYFKDSGTFNFYPPCFYISNIDNEKEKEIQVFPNPAINRVHIDLGDDPVNGLLKVYDVMGREYLTFTLNNYQNDFDINTGCFPNGIYSIVLYKSGESIVRKLFIDRY